MKTVKKLIWIIRNGKPILLFLIISTSISSLLSLVGVYNAFVSKSLIDSAIALNVPSVYKWLFIMGLIMFSKIAINSILTLIRTHVTIKFNQNMQKNLYKHIIFSKFKDQSKINSMNLVTRIQNDVSTISSMLLDTIPSIISLIVTFIASLSALLYLAPSIAIIAIIIGPLLIFISRIFGIKLKALYKYMQENDVKYKSFLQETICNSPIIKSFCLENYSLNKVDEIQKEKYNLSMKNTKIRLYSGLTMSFSTSITYFSIFCFSAINIAQGLSTYGTMTAMLQLYNNVKSPFQSLASMFPGFIASIAASERLIEIEKMELEDLDSYNLINNKSYATFSKSPSINFKDVCFSYNDKNNILNKVNIKIESGEIVALVGPSGEGKTTIIKLLLSLIDKTSGDISFINDRFSENLSPNHREIISYVPQGNTLFTGTIKSNILLGNPNASMKDIITTTKQAEAFDFITALKDGFNTKIGEKGQGISEGQAQRISIARAFLKKKPILILDEATSSLDEETELKIINSVKSLSHKPTCIIITHRPYALSICDRILKLEKGKINDITYKKVAN